MISLPLFDSSARISTLNLPTLASVSKTDISIPISSPKSSILSSLDNH